MPGWPISTWACAESNGDRLRRTPAAASAATSGTGAQRGARRAACAATARAQTSAVTRASACARSTAPTIDTLARQARISRSNIARMSATSMLDRLASRHLVAVGMGAVDRACERLRGDRRRARIGFLDRRDELLAFALPAGLGEGGLAELARRQLPPPWAADRDRSGCAARSSCGRCRRRRRTTHPGRPRLRPAGSRPPPARRRWRECRATPCAAVTLARPILPAGSRRSPASKSICTSTIGQRMALHQVDLDAIGLGPVFDRNHRPGRRREHTAPQGQANNRRGIVRDMVMVVCRSSVAPQCRAPAAGRPRLARRVRWLGPQRGDVSWSSPKYVFATACTCSAVTSRRRATSRDPASSGRPSAQLLPSDAPG